MDKIKVYYHQVDYQGYYLFSFIPDESPREPGVPLVPAGCTAVCPPSFDREKEIARLVEGKWILEPLPEPKKEEPESILKRLWRKFK